MTVVAEALEQEKQLEELLKKVKFIEYETDEEEAIIQWITNRESKENDQK
jgi:DNA polymerase III delta subunit